MAIEPWGFVKVVLRTGLCIGVVKEGIPRVLNCNRQN